MDDGVKARDKNGLMNTVRFPMITKIVMMRKTMTKLLVKSNKL